MCATFTLAAEDLTETLREIARRIEERYGEARREALLSQDLFPGQEVPVRGPGGWGLLHWGIPLSSETKRLVFNARVESILERPLFRRAVQRRCLVPATGFYEWDHRSGQAVRMRICPEGMQNPFLMAGLWDYARIGGQESRPCLVILTAPALPPISDFHDRMPILMTEVGQARWLDGSVPLSDGIDGIRSAGGVLWEGPLRMVPSPRTERAANA